jgi:hypothetical protein
VKINTDEQPELGARFGVQSIPTLILLEGGREKDRVIGARSAGPRAARLGRRETPGRFSLNPSRSVSAPTPGPALPRARPRCLRAP